MESERPKFTSWFSCLLLSGVSLRFTVSKMENYTGPKRPETWHGIDAPCVLAVAVCSLAPHPPAFLSMHFRAVGFVANSFLHSASQSPYLPFQPNPLGGASGGQSSGWRVWPGQWLGLFVTWTSGSRRRCCLVLIVGAKILAPNIPAAVHTDTTWFGTTVEGGSSFLISATTDFVAGPANSVVNS